MVARRGDRAGAFGILRGHVDELLQTGYTDLASNAAVEFITMMAAIGILWSALCLMWGPLFRKTAIFLMTLGWLASNQKTFAIAASFRVAVSRRAPFAASGIDDS